MKRVVSISHVMSHEPEKEKQEKYQCLIVVLHFAALDGANIRLGPARCLEDFRSHDGLGWDAFVDVA